jgi:hypothetical protein
VELTARKSASKAGISKGLTEVSLAGDQKQQEEDRLRPSSSDAEDDSIHCGHKGGGTAGVKGRKLHTTYQQDSVLT